MIDRVGSPLPLLLFLDRLLLLLLWLFFIIVTFLGHLFVFFGLCVLHFLVFEVLELPDSVALPFSELGEGLLDKDDVGELQILVELIEVTQLRLQKVVAENGVVEVQNIAEVSVHVEGLIIHSKVLFPLYFDRDLPELLLQSRPTLIKLIINVFNVDHNEFAHAVPAKHRLEAVLPINGSINLKWLHRLHI